MTPAPKTDNPVVDLSVYVKKNAIIAAVGVLETDARNDHNGFDYISYGKILNALKPALLDSHADVQVNIDGGRADLTFTDIETGLQLFAVLAPKDLPKDAAGSYLDKYALMKFFHIADPDDPEALVGKSEPRPQQRAATPRPAATQPTGAQAGGAVTLGPDGIPTDRLCPLCKAAELKSRKGYPSKFWPEKTACDGFRQDAPEGASPWVNHSVAELLQAYAPIAAVEAPYPGQAYDDSPVDDDEIDPDDISF